MNRIFIALTATIICFQLSAQDKANVIAHRGYWQASGSAQNSIAALTLASDINVYGSEFDVHLTSDDIPVIYHDGKIDSIDIQRSPYSAIKDLKLPNGESLPTLREYLEAAKCTSIQLILEIKPHATPERNRKAADIAVELVKEKQLLHRTEFITFNLDAGRELIRIAPGSDVYYLNGDLQPQALKTIGFAGLDYNYGVMQKHPEWFREAKTLGLKINVWTVNDTTVMREMLDMGADFITTDKPIDAMSFISAYGNAANSSIGLAHEDRTKIQTYNGSLHVSTPAETTAQIYTLAGQLVKTVYCQTGATSVNLAKGLYFVRIQENTYKIEVN